MVQGPHSGIVMQALVRLKISVEAYANAGCKEQSHLRVPIRRKAISGSGEKTGGLGLGVCVESRGLGQGRLDTFKRLFHLSL